MADPCDQVNTLNADGGLYLIVDGFTGDLTAPAPLPGRRRAPR
ncbi:hypothetical protein ACH4E7_23305 [Kitasatospora sp. NPDC018058]